MFPYTLNNQAQPCFVLLFYALGPYPVPCSVIVPFPANIHIYFLMETGIHSITIEKKKKDTADPRLYNPKY